MKTILSLIVWAVLATLLAGCAPSPDQALAPDSRSAGGMISWRASDGETDDPIILALCQRYNKGDRPVYVQWIDYQRIVGTDDWYVAMCDWEEDWWGSFDIFRWNGEQLITAGASPGREFSQSIHEVGSFMLEGFDNPIVMVIDTTHMGNREVFLFELDVDAGVTHHLLSARNRLSSSFDRYSLDLTFEDVSGDGHVDAVLAGDMTQLPRPNEAGELTGPTTIVPIRKVYLWNGYARRFELSADYSTGVGSWDDFDTGYAEAFGDER